MTRVEFDRRAAFTPLQRGNIKRVGRFKRSCGWTLKRAEARGPSPYCASVNMRSSEASEDKGVRRPSRTQGFLGMRYPARCAGLIFDIAPRYLPLYPPTIFTCHEHSSPTLVCIRPISRNPILPLAAPSVFSYATRHPSSKLPKKQQGLANSSIAATRQSDDPLLECIVFWLSRL